MASSVWIQQTATSKTATYERELELSLCEFLELELRVCGARAHGVDDLAAKAPDHVELGVEQQQVAHEWQHVRLALRLLLEREDLAGDVVVHVHFAQVFLPLIVGLALLLLALDALHAAVHRDFLNAQCALVVVLVVLVVQKDIRK